MNMTGTDWLLTWTISLSIPVTCGGSARGTHIYHADGFFGCWLLESFAWANDQLRLNASALVLTRNLKAFRRKVPHLTENPAIKFHTGDVRSFDFPGRFIHACHPRRNRVERKVEYRRTPDHVRYYRGGDHRTLDFTLQSGGRIPNNQFGGGVRQAASRLTHIPESTPAHPIQPTPIPPMARANAPPKPCARSTQNITELNENRPMFAFVGRTCPGYPLRHRQFHPRRVEWRPDRCKW